MRARVLMALAFAAMVTVTPAFATGTELTEREIVDLHAGRMVVREDDIERAGRHYIGGVSYIMIDAPAERVTRALDDVGAYRDILPRTRQVRWLAMSRDGDSIVELEQGNAVAHGKYVVRVHHDRKAPDDSVSLVRFWIDRRFSHDISDANGFFRVEAVGERTLLTYLVMVDLGGGFFRQMFEGRIRRAALSTPALVKRYVESHPIAAAL